MAPKKLKRASEFALFEPEQTSGTDRPLEWRRNYNFVEIPITDLDITTTVRVHRFDYGGTSDLSEKGGPNPFLSSDCGSTLMVSGFIDDDKMRDALFVAKKSKEGQDEYDVFANRGPIRVTIKSGSPAKTGEEGINGLYTGCAYYSEEPHEHGLGLELPIPHEQMISLVSALKEERAENLNLFVRLLSYTYEVDDSLREPWMRRDIIISGTPFCFLVSVSVSSQKLTTKPDNEEESQDIPAYKAEEDAELTFKRSVLQLISSHHQSTSKLVSAAWALVIVVALTAILK